MMSNTPKFFLEEVAYCMNYAVSYRSVISGARPIYGKLIQSSILEFWMTFPEIGPVQEITDLYDTV